MAAGHYAAAQFLVSKGDSSSAVDHFREALSFAPDNLGLLLNLAVLYLRQSQFTTAMDPLEHARRVSPNSADVAKLMGWAYYGANKMDQAVAEWQRAEKLRPDAEVERALEKAERECMQDADERAAARERGAKRRHEEDRLLVARMTQQIGTLFPGCPSSEAAAIAGHAAQRGSGRIGRTQAGRKLDEQALTLAVSAAIRHNHTDYDELLANGLDRAAARRRVTDRVEEILAAWRK